MTKAPTTDNPSILPVDGADAIKRIRIAAFNETVQWQRPGAPPEPLLVEGFLQTPRFVPHPPLLSAMVMGLFGATARISNGAGYAARIGWADRDGPTWGEFPCLPGWAENDLARRAPDLALMQRFEPIMEHLIADRLGGSVWADAPSVAKPAGLTLVFVSGPLPVAEAMLDAALAHTEAARLVMVESASLQALPADDFILLADRLRRAGGQAVAAPCDPWPLLDCADALHCAGDDPAALLGLLTKKKVHCHTSGFAAGWGPTIDSPLVRKQSASRTCLEILAAALMTGSRYANPFTSRQISIENAIDLAADWRRLGKVNRRIGGLAGFPKADRAHFQKFFHTGHHAPPAGEDAADASAGKFIALWQGETPDQLVSAIKAAGLGTVLTSPGVVQRPGEKPISVVIDDQGDFRDPSRGDGLEKLLNKATFDFSLLTQVQSLTATIRSDRISLSAGPIGEPVTVNAPRGQRRMLLLDDQPGANPPGQLLERLRATYQDAYILYVGETGRGQTAKADRLLKPAEALSILKQVDDVHTGATSLGFEALLHGFRPVCERASFYAGWGLTTDKVAVPRRERSLTLEELTAGVLLLYNRYIDPVTGFQCGLNVLLERLREPLPAGAAASGAVTGWFRRLFG